jgi:hypothetical protein
MPSLLTVRARQPSFSMLVTPSTKSLPDDVEKESQRVRSMYEQDYDWREGGRSPGLDAQIAASRDEEVFGQ